MANQVPSGLPPRAPKSRPARIQPQMQQGSVAQSILKALENMSADDSTAAYCTYYKVLCHSFGYDREQAAQEVAKIDTEIRGSRAALGLAPVDHLQASTELLSDYDKASWIASVLEVDDCHQDLGLAVLTKSRLISVASLASIAQACKELHEELIKKISMESDEKKKAASLEELERAIAARQDALTVLEQATALKQQTLEALNLSVSTAQERAGTAELTLNARQQELQSAQQELDAKQASNTAMDLELSTKQPRLAAVQHELETMREELGSVQHQLETAQRDLQSVLQEVASKQAQAAELDESIGAKQTLAAGLDASHLAKQAQAAELDESNGAQQTLADYLDTSNLAKQAQAADLDAAISAKQFELQQVNDELSQVRLAQEQLEQAGRETARLQDAINQTHVQIVAEVAADTIELPAGINEAEGQEAVMDQGGTAAPKPLRILMYTGVKQVRTEEAEKVDVEEMSVDTQDVKQEHVADGANSAPAAERTSNRGHGGRRVRDRDVGTQEAEVVRQAVPATPRRATRASASVPASPGVSTRSRPSGGLMTLEVEATPRRTGKRPSAIAEEEHEADSIQGPASAAKTGRTARKPAKRGVVEDVPE